MSRLLCTPITPRVVCLMGAFTTAFTHRRWRFITAVFNYCFSLNFEFPPLKGRNCFHFVFFFTSAYFYFSQKVLSQRRSSKISDFDVAQASGGSKSQISTLFKLPVVFFEARFLLSIFFHLFLVSVHGFLSTPFSF